MTMLESQTCDGTSDTRQQLFELRAALSQCSSARGSTDRLRSTDHLCSLHFKLCNEGHKSTRAMPLLQTIYR